MKRVYIIILSFLLLCPGFQIFASDLSERALVLFMENKPQEAAPLLELAAREAGADERLYLYLGIAYQQLNRWDDAINAFRKGLSSSFLYRHLYQFNIANSFFAQGKTSFALEYYDQAIEARPDYALAWLNRANARLKLGEHNNAIDDYTVYLSLDPYNSQAAKINDLISRLKTRQAEDEYAMAQAEAARIANEKAREAMLEAVTQSLLEGATDTTSLSAGSGSMQTYEDDLPLDE